MITPARAHLGSKEEVNVLLEVVDANALAIEKDLASKSRRMRRGQFDSVHYEGSGAQTRLHGLMRDARHVVHAAAHQRNNVCIELLHSRGGVSKVRAVPGAHQTS